MTEFVKTIPVYPNKWRFYMAPLMKDTPEMLEFNWFLCARPFRDSEGNCVVEVGRYTLFFDESSGKSYHVTFDATEKEPIRLLIASHPTNKQNHPQLRNLCDSDKSELSQTCDLRTHTTDTFEFAKSLGYEGAAIRVEPCRGGCKCDLVCNSAEFLFDRSVVEESKWCPYIDYARSHSSHLRKQVKGFPSSKKLEKARPGKFSLELKTILAQYFDSTSTM